MVKFRSWTESGCVATRLILCLLIGIRLLSSSVQGATCGLRLRSTPSSQQQETQDQRQTAPPAPKWGVEMFGNFKPAPRVERRNSTESIPMERSKSDSEAAGVKTSQSDTSNDCEPESHNRHRSGACVGQPARDFLDENNSETAAPSRSASSAQPFDAYEGSSTTSSTPSSGSSNDIGSDTDPSEVGNSSSTSHNSDRNSLSSSSSTNTESLGSSSLSSSSSQSLPSALPSPSPQSSPSAQDLPPPPSGTLPNINFGDSLNGSSGQSKNNESGTNSNATISSGSSTPQSNQSSSSDHKTKAIAAGVTVPVGVLALGLIALVILHKQRQRKKNIEQGQILSRGQNEEMTDTPATQVNTPKLPTRQLIPTAALYAASSHGRIEHTSEHGAEEHHEEAQAGTEVSSALSHTTALTRPVTPAATSTNAPTTEARPGSQGSPAREGGTRTETSSQSSHRGSNPGNMRGKSLKRKPVPALLDTFEPAKLTPPPSVAQPSAASHSFPIAAAALEAACTSGHPPVDQTLTTSLS